MKIYAVRHGQTDMNAKGRIQGSKSDLPLNKTGRKQALDAAKSLSDKGIGLIVTSPMKRAMETAGIIAEQLKIAGSKMVIGTRLRERDFGDYEGRLMSEVDINSLRRWTDNAPTPGGETIRELAARVFEFLDERIEDFERMAASEHFSYLCDEYRKQHGEDSDSDIMFESVERSLKELNDVAILFVVHGHVLRCMHWYFKGLPSGSNATSRDDGGAPTLGEETVIKTANCGFYEFDTEKIPPEMEGFQIVLDRQTLEAKLKRLLKSPYESSYNYGVNLCYMPDDDDFEEVTHEKYSCPVCGDETEHTNGSLWELNGAREALMDITKSRIKIDAMLDEREYCRCCAGKLVKNPQPVFKIRFSPSDQYHEARTGDSDDYSCLIAFIKSLDEYDGAAEWCNPLIDHVDRIVKMTGLCPEIVEDWRKWVKKQKRWQE